MSKEKQLFIIAGSNGAGKTTTALTLLPDFIIEEYVNADLIAGALSPFKPETVAIQAGRLMLRRIDDLKKQKRNFAFETTLASKSFLKLLNECKEDGYKTNLIFLWLDSQNLAMQRVGFRVQNGGHDIPQEVIKRRYQRGLYNLFNLYIPAVDNWWLYDNSGDHPDIISEKLINQTIKVLRSEIWDQLQRQYLKGK